MSLEAIKILTKQLPVKKQKELRAFLNDEIQEAKGVSKKMTEEEKWTRHYTKLVEKILKYKNPNP